MTDKKEDGPEFEEALEKLETIIESMESGEIPLTELVERFEQGNKLLDLCQKKLKDAELKIERLNKQKNPPELEEFGLESGV